MNNELKIITPRRGTTNSAEAYWDLVRNHGRSRKSMVAFICGIGGYSDRDGRYAIEFNVKDYYSDTSEDFLWKLLCSDKMDVGPDKDLPPAHMAIAKALFHRVYAEHEDNILNWGREEAYEDWKDSDTPYETFTGERVDWEFELNGRGGGHLCMTDCDGYSLKCSPEELEEAINGDADDEPWPPATVRKLFIICVQNTVDLESRKIAAEVEYRAAWRLWASFVEDDLREAIELYDTREELAEDVKEILQVLRGEFPMPVTPPAEWIDTLTKLCQLADVSTD